MGQTDWNVPRTEEGLQQVLHGLERCRAASNLVEVGNGLLALSFLVKWVRSDTSQPPFVRSHELALEALEAFRQARDVKGQVRALVAATAMTDPGTRESLLSEAASLAEEIGDEDCVAMVLAAKARGLALADREQASELQRRVLEIYRRTGNERGIAQCLFSLSIGSGTSAEKRDCAVEAARLYREMREPAEAARCVMIAMMNAEEIEPLGELESLAREGLQDALDAGDRGDEGHFYGKLAVVVAAKGQFEEAAKYQRWAADLRDADGLTPLERWKGEVEMAKMMIGMAKTQGHKDAAKLFQDELKSLKASKPKS